MPAAKDKRVVLVTGCSDGGIGAALCVAFQQAGCTVFATARRLESMAGLQARGIRTLPLDVTDAASVSAAVKAVVSEAGRVDVLVNNAGMGLVAPLAEVDLEQARALYDTNVWGALRMVQAVVPYMAAQRAGVVANVGSVVGYLSTPWGGVYSSSKAALHSMTDALRLELAPFGIRTVLIAPGAVRSNIGANNLRRFDDHFTLYAPFAPVIRERTVLSQGARSMDTAVFAAATARAVLAARPPRVCMRGGFVWMIKLAMWWPLWFRDWMLARQFKLNQLLPLPAKKAE